MKKIDMSKSQGFTMTEMLVSIAIFAVVLLATFTLIWNIQGRNVKSRTALQREQDAELFSRALASASRFAVKVSSIPLSPTKTNYADGVGAFHSTFNYRSLASAPAGSVIPLAIFLRESTVSLANSNSVRSSWRPTGIFFLPPTATSAGTLYLTMGTANSGASNLRPSNSDITLQGVTEVYFSNVRTLTDRLTSVDMHIVYRIPLSSEGVTSMVWCPAQDITAAVAGCLNSAPFKDVTKKISLLFSNNRLNHIIPSSQFLKGAYYFRASQN